MALYNSILDVIGDTPLLKLEKEKCGLKNIQLYAKLEYLNPFGSIKDRTALGMLKPLLNDAQRNNKAFIEASSGNTIKAMQAIASIHGLTSTSITNRIKIPEIRDILLAMGVEIIETPGKSSCIDPTNPEDPLYVINDLLTKNPHTYIYPNQYYNEDNPQIHYEKTGEEILNDLPTINYLFATLGTTGSSQGITRKIKEVHPDVISIGIAAARDDYIPGIRNENDLMDVGIFDKSYYDTILYERSVFAIEGMLDLIRKFGILAGPTSGAVYSVAMKYLKKIDKTLSPGNNYHAVIIICDRMEWYMSYLKERKPEIFGHKPNPQSIRSFSYNPNEVPTIKNDSVEEFLNQKKPLVIDVRSNLAYKFGHLSNAINITDTFLEDIVDNKMPFAKNKPLLFVCARGLSSARFACYMKQRGYDAYSLQDGMNNLSLPLDKEI